MPNLKSIFSIMYIVTSITTSTIASPVFAQLNNEAIENTQTKLSNAAQTATDTASKLAGEAQVAISHGLRIGKAESLLFFNKHLNGYKIDVSIQDNKAKLTGQVSQSVEKDLAEQLILSVDGITHVKNKIVVKASTQKNTFGGATEQLSASFKDATITASIKAKLLSNSNIKGLKINVDTYKSEVTLRGEAASQIESDLIEQIALNTSGAQKVINQISIVN